LEKTKEEQGNIMHALKIFEGKFELFCKSQHGIRFRVTPRGQRPEQQEEAKGTLSPSGSKKCPIDVDEYEPTTTSRDDTKEAHHQAGA
jgi:hypothetical protein